MSSKRALRRKRCLRKIAHPTHQAALAALFHTGRAAGRPQLEVYRCPHCGLFHVGHRVGVSFTNGGLKAVARGRVRPKAS